MKPMTMKPNASGVSAADSAKATQCQTTCNSIPKGHAGTTECCTSHCSTGKGSAC